MQYVRIFIVSRPRTMRVGQFPFLDWGDINSLVRGSMAETSMIFRPTITWCVLVATHPPSDVAAMLMLRILAELSSFHVANSNFAIFL